MTKPAAGDDSQNRIVAVTLDEESIGRSGPDIEHERAIAIYDLIEQNLFAPEGADNGPFTPDGATAHLHATDAEGEWLLRFVGTTVEVSHGHAKGDLMPPADQVHIIRERIGRDVEEAGRARSAADAERVRHRERHVVRRLNELVNAQIPAGNELG